MSGLPDRGGIAAYIDRVLEEMGITGSAPEYERIRGEMIAWEEAKDEIRAGWSHSVVINLEREE